MSCLEEMYWNSTFFGFCCSNQSITLTFINWIILLSIDKTALSGKLSLVALQSFSYFSVADRWNASNMLTYGALGLAGIIFLLFLTALIVCKRKHQLLFFATDNWKALRHFIGQFNTHMIPNLFLNRNLYEWRYNDITDGKYFTIFCIYFKCESLKLPTHDIISSRGNPLEYVLNHVQNKQRLAIFLFYHKVLFDSSKLQINRYIL